ncbi:ligase-associated DNA damage response endonuclease PdeM [Aporhodopirellula aestuarii]|uniref:Ligase-associated DNA damage response endonuclease PdeM n=1 Tax=Aporhodopirellula aestuarii TaxID=2950107 RepID=A0ABT0UDI7_9BACT|nr:ligase-associated DNA damage response endonuclease PdeM [Aporhodopirellula aestuarii]MCM2374810.1 ligase-associated DNA damage response endonuclease PdeM [Aporhodopirellula aestuarii]
MPGVVDINLNGVELTLCWQGGLYWPDENVLFVADTHFGKEATFRRHGIPVPVGSSKGTLAAIDSLLESTRASRLVILGDMFHARSSLSRDVITALESFFARHRDLVTTLVRGNHDAHIGRLPVEWPIEIIDPYERIGDVVMTHHPQPIPDDASLLVCGHLHPAVRVSDSIGTLPCFHYRSGVLVLPAIGRFTGTHVVDRGRDDRAWGIAKNEVFSVPSGSRLYRETRGN